MNALITFLVAITGVTLVGIGSVLWPAPSLAIRQVGRKAAAGKDITLA